MSPTDDAPPAPAGFPIPLHDLLALDYTFGSGPPGTAEVRMPVRPEALGFTGNLHGGAIATMVDLACALAAVNGTSFDPHQESLVTVDMHIRYLGRARTDTVIARAKVLKTGRQLIVIDCQVVDGDDHLIASADFSMMMVPLRDPLVAGLGREPGRPEL